MPFQRRINRPTKAEQARQDKCRRWGCIACHMEGLIKFNEYGEAYSNAGDSTIHHQTVNGFTQSQDQSVCLCTWHHQAHCRWGYTARQMTEKYGPSLQRGSVPFYERYGRNPEQLEFQDALIAGAEEVAA